MTGMNAPPDLRPDAAIAPAAAPTLVPLPASAPRAIPGGARGKLYIKTHGCQMNEYDSAKMADVLAEHEGLEPTRCRHLQIN